MVNPFVVIILSILTGELIALIMLILFPNKIDRICHECDLGWKVLFTFLLWCSMCGADSFTITSTYNGKEKQITFEGWRW